MVCLVFNVFNIFRDFDHTSSSFTLENIIKLNFQDFAEDINEISDAASRELQIENVRITILKT